LFQRAQTREARRGPMNDTITDWSDWRAVVTVKPVFGRVDSIFTPLRALSRTTSPPPVRNVRRNAVPPLGSGTGTQASGPVDGGLVGSVGRGEGKGGGVGDGVGDGAGAALRRSAAEIGEIRFGAAATRTDRIPNQAIPTVTAVATAHAIGYTSRWGTGLILP
jgi:hypothetical protein